MPVTLNHTIIHAKDKAATAEFLTDILGLPKPKKLAHFTIVQVGEISLDFLETSDQINSRHFAFLVSEKEFDEISERIRANNVTYWADPFQQQPDEINRWDDGRGLYFEDPNGHLLEIITRPYGSGGLEAKHPNPLLLG